MNDLEERIIKVQRHREIVDAIEAMHKQTTEQLRIIIFVAVFFTAKALADLIFFG